MSDSVLNGDLFRFYKNPDFKKVNPGKYEYKSGPKGNEKKQFFSELKLLSGWDIIPSKIASK